MPELKSCRTKLEIDVLSDDPSHSGEWRFTGKQLTVAEVSAAAVAAIPALMGTGLDLKPLSAIRLSEVDEGKLYTAAATWSVKSTDDNENDPNNPAPVVNGSLDPQTVHITKGFEHRGSWYKSPAIQATYTNPLDPYEGGLNVHPDGVKGADIESSQLSFSIDLPLPNGFVNLELIQTRLRPYKDVVNSLPFMTFDAGEVRLHSSTFNTTADGETVDRVVLNLAIRDNLYNFIFKKATNPINDVVVPVIYGWDHRWVEWGQELDDPYLPNPQPVRIEKALHIDRVYPYADLNLILA